MVVRISLLFCLAAVATPALAGEQEAAEAHELANVNQACRVILRSTKAGETSKDNAKKWDECVRTCAWGDIQARYLGFGKGASGAWRVRLEKSSGEKVVIPYDKLDNVSQQRLKDIGTLKGAILKDAAVEEARALAKDKATERATEEAKRSEHPAAPSRPPKASGSKGKTAQARPGDPKAAARGATVAKPSPEESQHEYRIVKDSSGTTLFTNHHATGPKPSPETFQNVAKKVLPSVVTLINTKRSPNMAAGIIIDPSGIILTNNHVLSGGGQITVRLADGREFARQEIKTDPATDLAIVRIENSGPLPAASFGDSDALKIGDQVAALGQPSEGHGAVSTGSILAVRFDPWGLREGRCLLTDAAIGPRDSGGPLVNLDGQVVGINDTIRLERPLYKKEVGPPYGTAIPANLAKWVCGQLIGSGKVCHAYLGVELHSMSQSTTQYLAKKSGVAVTEGAWVGDVGHGTPAAKAGLRREDVIVKVGGKNVSSPQELQAALEAVPSGAAQQLTVVREGKPLELSVVPGGEQPDQYGPLQCPVDVWVRGVLHVRMPTTTFEKLGIAAQTLTPDMAAPRRGPPAHGVVIDQVYLDSPTGWKEGWVIVECAHQPVATVEDLSRILASQSLEKGISFVIHGSRTEHHDAVLSPHRRVLQPESDEEVPCTLSQTITVGTEGKRRVVRIQSHSN